MLRLAGRSREQLLSELFEGPRRSFVPVLDSKVIEQPGWWQLITPSFRNGGLNEIALSVLSTQTADGVIERTSEMYARLGLQFRWTVGPESAPSDLALRLSRRGMQEHPVAGVIVDIAHLDLTEVDSAASVLLVALRSEADFTEVMAKGWGVERDVLERYHRALLVTPGARTHMFVAYIDGRAAGAASYVAQQESAFFIGGLVLPEFRARGVYRALVRARARHALSLGLQVAASHAGTMSAPILARMGFQEACTFSIFTSTSAQ
jgi:GNAT superfamily N-acetyltransferase